VSSRLQRFCQLHQESDGNFNKIVKECLMHTNVLWSMRAVFQTDGRRGNGNSNFSGVAWSLSALLSRKQNLKFEI
jgi:hypothetical protein